MSVGSGKESHLTACGILYEQFSNISREEFKKTITVSQKAFYIKISDNDNNKLQ